MRLCNINKSLQKAGNKMKYFEVVFYYFLPIPEGLLKKVKSTNQKDRKGLTQRTQRTEL
jgi:hypothetical protein